MSAQDFVDGLAALGYEVREPQVGVAEFDYAIEVGRCQGQTVCLAFAVPQDFPLSCPSGPNISPRLVPLHPAQDVGHPIGGVHEAPQFGDEWQYWSRPFPDWAASERTVRAYMAHIRRLFATL